MKPSQVISVCLALAMITVASSARASRLFISATPTNPALADPVIVVAPGSTSSFYLFWQETPNDQLLGISHDIISSTANSPTPVISRQDYSIANPSILGTTRWNPGFISTGSTSAPASFIVDDATAGNLSGSNLGFAGNADPTFDAATGTYLFGTVTFHADNLGTTQIKLGVGNNGIAFNAASNPDSTLNFGFGDALVSGKSPGATSTSPDAFITVMAPSTSNPLHNTNDKAKWDVDGDGMVTAFDALIIINALNNAGNTIPVTVPPPASLAPPPFMDVEPDNLISGLDAIEVINELNDPTRFSSIAMAVPEPSSLALITSASCLFMGYVAARRRGAKTRG